MDDIALYIIEHYGDGKDSKKVESKVKAAYGYARRTYFLFKEEDDLKKLERY